MSTIQTPRYEQFTKRLLRIVGGGIMPRLQNDLSPVINIEDPADHALLFWKGHKLASASVSVPITAVRFGAAGLFNPLGSGRLITIETITLRSGGGNFVTFSLTQTRTLNVLATLSFTDSRASLAAVPVGEIGEDDFAAVPANFFRVVASATTVFLRPSIVLAPGVGLLLTNNTAATAWEANFTWLERDAETTELEV